MQLMMVVGSANSLNSNSSVSTRCIILGQLDQEGKVTWVKTNVNLDNDQQLQRAFKQFKEDEE